jgi:hypothetical protein
VECQKILYEHSKKAGSVFFSEEKNQKTFTSCAGSAGEGGGGLRAALRIVTFGGRESVYLQTGVQ